MVNVILKGVDEYLGVHVETKMAPMIAKIYKVDSDDVIFTCMHSTIYHAGTDQTSYHMVVTVETNTTLKQYEEEAANYILEASSDFSLHCRVNFSYVDRKEYTRINKDYPLYMTKTNTIDFDEEFDDEYEDDEEDIYLGNVFAPVEDFLKK